MEQYRWIWLIVFVVSVGWLGVEYDQYKTAQKNGTLITNQLSSADSEASFSSVPSVNDVPVVGSEVSKPQLSNHSDSDQILSIQTDVFDLSVSETGGVIDKVGLKQYSVSIDQPDQPTYILNPDEFVIQTGLVSHQQAPSHKAHFHSKQKGNIELREGEDQLSLPLYWEQDGIKVTKTFVFRRGSYVIDVITQITNESGVNWSANAYAQLVRERPTEGSGALYTYPGPAIYTPEDQYQKIDFDDIEDSKLDIKVADSWLAMLQHYFLAAIIPASKESVKLFTNNQGSKYYLGYRSNRITVAPGETIEHKDKLFVGPTKQDLLVEVHPQLDYAVDYGVFHVIAAPLFWLLKNIYEFVGNWGVAILLVTLVIKLVFFKLSEKSYRSMAKLRQLTPRIQQLKERYGDDKQALNKKMMSIYKEEKVNPLGGCLPILIQIPVFISLYWVLIENVEMRQAPFMLWINDLSIEDPFYVLPVLMGISMWVQQKLNPAPTDPMQAKVMQFLPLIFTALFLFFPAGLVLYWVINNILSIAQQWLIIKRVEAEG